VRRKKLTEVLEVVANGENASHNAGDIYEHILNGGSAIFRTEDGRYYGLWYSNEYYACFGDIADDYLGTLYQVDENGGVSAHELELVSSREVQDIMALPVYVKDAKAPFTAIDIHDHVQHGGTAFLITEDQYYYGLWRSCEYDAWFGHIADDGTGVVYYVDQYGNVSEDELGFASSSEVYSVRTMHVYVDDDDKASHTATEILDHINAGGNAVLNRRGEMHSFMYGNGDIATFGEIMDDNFFYLYSINDEKDVYDYEAYFVTYDYIESRKSIINVHFQKPQGYDGYVVVRPHGGYAAPASSILSRLRDGYLVQGFFYDAHDDLEYTAIGYMHGGTMSYSGLDELHFRVEASQTPFVLAHCPTEREHYVDGNNDNEQVGNELWLRYEY
jgi:hypothetical protein